MKCAVIHPYLKINVISENHGNRRISSDMRILVNKNSDKKAATDFQDFPLYSGETQTLFPKIVNTRDLYHRTDIKLNDNSYLILK